MAARQGDRLLIFGGPYSNLAATQALRGIAQALGIPPGDVVCTGDVVAYCAHPAETVALIRDWGCHVIAGNCEIQLAEDADDCGCGFAEGSTCDALSQGWYTYARGRVDSAARRWMASLPRSLAFERWGVRFRAIHGGVAETSRFVFASQVAVIEEELARACADVVLAGHCGIPFAYRSSNGVWFNTGALGMPANDGTPDVWYGLIQRWDGSVRFSLHRLSYGFEDEAAAVIAAGAAIPYGEALRTGLWPSLDVLPAQERTATGVPVRPDGLVIPGAELAIRATA